MNQPEYSVKDHMENSQQLIQAYNGIRDTTTSLCQPLVIEDYVIQSHADVSPPKWHLAHTTWFFETFILSPYCKGYQLFHPQFHQLFNSYYQTIGNPYPRTQRGLLARPTVETVYAYRKSVDAALRNFIEYASNEILETIKSILILGLHHEQQHQELLLMDIKHNFSMHPDFPTYQQPSIATTSTVIAPQEFITASEGTVTIGHVKENEFCFDNELPPHAVILKPYAISPRLVTNAEFCEFIQAGGYQAPEWWLADGWECAQKNAWEAPLYWRRSNKNWEIFTLNGLKNLHPNEPVTHVSYYEADAYARWRGLRLPSETEWENYANTHSDAAKANFLETKLFHPRPASNTGQQLLGDVWEWTASSYLPYPGYKPLAGALGEYNGKFMNNQMVLRGGSCATPQAHIRNSYRNFFQPDKRWQFSGMRLASD